MGRSFARPAHSFYPSRSAMSSTKIKRASPIMLDQAQVERIIAAVREGATPEAAAGAEGLSRHEFDRAMARGQTPKTGVFRMLALGVAQAVDRARVDAELRVYAKDPLSWLKAQPGGHGGHPDWKKEKLPPISHQAVNVLLNPQISTVMNTVLAQLLDFPEARSRVAQALGQLDLPGV